MEMNPMFSIIVPVYNAAPFVEETIHNLLKQNVDKEILLVNDGSTDNSLEILQQYANAYDCIRIINKKNGGVSSARNVGLDEALGQYVIFVDSDDFIEDGLLKRCEGIFEKKNTESVFFSYKYVYPRSSCKDVCFHYKPSGCYSVRDWIDEFYRLWLCHILSCIGTKVYKRAVIEKFHIRFNESISYLEDVSFATEYLSHLNNLYYIDEPLYVYRIINPNSLITKFRPNYVSAMAFLHEKLEGLWVNVYGDHLDNLAEYYKVLGNNILGSVDNFVAHKVEASSVIDKELSYLANLSYLPNCIKYPCSFGDRLKLVVLKSDIVLLVKWYFEFNYKYKKIKWQLKQCLKQKILHAMR